MNFVIFMQANGNDPVAINLDNVLTIEPTSDFYICSVFFVDGTDIHIRASWPEVTAEISRP